MKILHINSYYSGSKFYKNLYNQQEKNGLDISVFVPVASILANIEDFGEYTTISVNHSKYDRFIFRLKHTKILKDITKKYDIGKYSLIHAHSLFSNGYIAMKLKEKYGISYVVAIRNTDVNTFFKYMIHLRRLGVDILVNASAVVFLSPGYRDEVINKYIPTDLKQYISAKSYVIPNGIDMFWLNNKYEEKSQKSSDLESLKVVSVAIVNRNKNQLNVCRAIEVIKKNYSHINYTIVGKIKNDKLMKKILRYSFVEYVPHTSKEELIHYYRNSDVFVMPSFKETFGLSYAESLTQGLPVVYSKGQGFDSQFPEGTVGYHIDPYNPSSIADGIEKAIVLKYKDKMDFVAVSEKFNWKTISNSYLEIYESITKKR